MFGADDVFRIDHYLGKETVQNLLALRFANTLFEPIWNGHHVDSVQITMAEDVGIGGRAQFYEKTGAARDVLQNHLLQLLALTAMEEPVEFSAEEIRTEKLKVLRAISLPDDLETFAVRGQYEQGWLAGQRANGYRQEEGVDPESTTETYAAVRLGVETRRWAGVPFYLRTGKRLPRRVTEIALVFKRAPHLPFADTDTEELGNNQLVVRVQPDEGVTLKFGSKVPGSVMEVRDVSMDFLYGEQFTEASPEAYERLLLDVLLGDATLFPRNAEVEASWAVIDPLEEFWAGTDAAPLPRRRVGPPRRRRDARRRGPPVAATVTRARPATCRTADPRRRHDDALGHHRLGRREGTGRAAAHRRRGALRRRAHAGRRRRREPGRRGRGGRHPRRRDAPVPGARRGAPADRRTGAPPGRRGAHRRPARARARPSSCACTAGWPCTRSPSCSRCSPPTPPSSPGGTPRPRTGWPPTRSRCFADRRITDSSMAERPASRR